ncbi:hypothetical protein [Rhodococcus sp. SJ-2]
MWWPSPDTGVVEFPGADVGVATFPGADTGIAVFPTPPIFTMPLDASVASAGTASADLVTTPVYPMDVVGVGTAGVAVSSTVSFDAAASGRGTAVARFAEIIEADVVGSGAASAVVTPSLTVDADASGAGTAAVSVTPAVAIAAAVEGVGTAGVGAWPSAAVAGAVVSSGTAGVDVTAHASFSPSGMNKSGTQTITTNTWTPVTGWSIRSGYPDTVIVSNGVEVPDGVEVDIVGQLTYSYQDSFSGNGMRIRVMAGATQIGETAGTPANSAVATLAPFRWKNETGAPQLVTVQGFSTSSSFGRNVINGGVGSFITLTPVVQLIERASDAFDGDGSLSANWATTGGGTLVRANGRLDGTNTPSVPLSYAWWHEPMPSDTQQVECVVRWDGRDPEHSACGLVVRADPFQDPVVNPGVQFGVQFSWTRGIMALYYEDYDATNGFVPVTGVAQYVNTSKFPEGAVVTLRAEGNLYTARVDGVIMLQGTVENSVIPFSRRYVGATIQNDELVSGGGGPPGRIDDFKAYTP